MRSPPTHPPAEPPGRPDPTRTGVGRRRRLLHLVLAWIAYLCFARSILYFIGFLGNVYVGHTIDGPPGTPPAGGAAPLTLALTNAGWVLAFALHHSIFARARTKRWVTRVLPPELERSSFVGASSAFLILLIWQWRPLPALVWSVEPTAGRAVLWAASAAGWVLALWSSLRLGHPETFGLRPALRRVQGREHVPRGVEQRAMYSVVRHPMYVGFLLGIWATPEMSRGHLLLAGLFSLYVIVGRVWEERDLLARHGDAYAAYRQRVGAFLPRWPRR